MAEIKSTLELIMEKTKGLTMSDEEKEAFQQKELEGKLRGSLQKVMEGRLKIERFKIELDTISQDKQAAARRFIIKDCISRIEPDRENARIIEVLGQLGKINCQPLRDLIAEYRGDTGGQDNEQGQELLMRLQEQGISGSAVMPNLKADSQYLQHMAEKKADFQEKLDALSAQWEEKAG
ncbi:hypothetical protein ACFL9T_06560 [Thermodesulfobacteriota bacterium]